MTTLTVEINKDAADLSTLQDLLNNMGLKFRIEDNEDWGDLSEFEIEGIKQA